MSIEERLICIYMFVCEHFPALAPMIERRSNNGKPEFSDEEVLAFYDLWDS